MANEQVQHLAVGHRAFDIKDVACRAFVFGYGYGYRIRLLNGELIRSVEHRYINAAGVMTVIMHIGIRQVAQILPAQILEALFILHLA